MRLLKILIVEDDSNIRKLYEKSLKKIIFETCFTSDGKEGLEAYKEWGPDIILLDMNLPIMSGFQVLKTIREEVRDMDTCIIVQTSKNEKENITECGKLGIQGYIIKPFSPLKIVDTILNYYSHLNPEKTKEIKLELEQHGGMPVEKAESADEPDPGLQEYCISANQIKLLKRLRKRLGITEKRSLELEHHLMKIKEQYTIEEFEYISVLRFCFEQGPIKEGVSKILNWQTEKHEIIKNCAIEPDSENGKQQ